MNRTTMRLTTFHRLGWANVARVAAYRSLLKLRLHPVQKISAERPLAPFFLSQSLPRIQGMVQPSEWRAFGWIGRPLVGVPPQWNTNVLTNSFITENDKPWWEYSDFDPEIGDIKGLWESSRFSWAPLLALRFRQGDTTALPRLNDWLEDWLSHNPPYKGRQWKCGQEASIRVLNLAISAIILGQTHNLPAGLKSLLALHLKRISPTMSYARAQDNNHGTSEAAALFIGGELLGANGDGLASAFGKSGRQSLEERVAALFNNQGGFSQYSTNYHRMALDTLSIAELVRRAVASPTFSDTLYTKARLAARWLFDRTTMGGDAPNFGANDGSILLCSPNAEYRDFRPSIQLAMNVFCGVSAFPSDVKVDAPLRMFGLQHHTASSAPPKDSLDQEGGTLAMHVGQAFVQFRFPRFAFRPSQADAHHVDFWLSGVNVLRDSGTFSYNTSEEIYRGFCGVKGHSAVEFDEHDQMPPLGRFLYGKWLRTTTPTHIEMKRDERQFSSVFADFWGCRHSRKIAFQDGSLRIGDELSGFEKSAVLRWQLAPGEWQLEKATDKEAMLKRPDIPFLTLHVKTQKPMRAEMRQTSTSVYYGKMEPAQVLNVSIFSSGTIETELRWQV